MIMVWQHWINFLAGIWLIISAYTLSASAMVTNLVVTGIIVAVLALWGALSPSDRTMNQMTR
jgi:hypothetical protein